MADLQKVIEVVFNATDNLGGEFNRIGNQMDTLAGKARSVTGPIADVTSGLLKAEAAALTMGVALLGLAYKESVAFESSLTDLKRVMDETDGSIDKYLGDIRSLSEEFGVAEGTITESAAGFKQAGFSIDESMILVRNTLLATKVSELDAAEATEQLTSTLKGFALDAQESGRILDVLNGTSNQYAVNFKELGTALADVAPTARTMGLTVEETTGLLTPLIENIRSGSESATSLSSVMLNMVQSSGAAKNALDELKISQKDTNGELRSAKDIMGSVAEIWPTLNDNQRTYYASQLGGKEQIAAFSILMNEFNRTVEVQAAAMDSAGASQKEWEVASNTSRVALDRFLVSVQGVAGAIGDEFRNNMTGVVNSTSTLAQSFRDIVQGGGLEPLFDQLRPLLDSVADGLRNVAELAPEVFAELDWTPIVEGFRAIGQELSEMFGGVDFTTAEGLESTFQTLINVGGQLLQVTAGIIDSFGPIIQDLASLASKAGDLDPQIAKLVGNFLGFGSALDGMLPLVEKLSSVLTAVGVSILALSSTGALGAASRGVAALTLSLKGLVAVLGAAGLAGAVGVVAFKITEWVDLNDRLIPGVDTLGTRIQGIVSGLRYYTGNMAEVSDSTQRSISAIEALNERMRQTDIPKEEIQQGTQAYEDMNEEIGMSLVEFNNWRSAQAVLSGSLNETTAAVNEKGNSIKTLGDSTTAYVEVIDEATGKVIGFTQTSNPFVEGEEKKQDALTETQESLLEYEARMEEIASNERIKTIEAAVNLNVAELEADTSRMVASFEALSATVESTGKLIGSLFGDLLEAESWWERNLIEDQIKRENKLREEAAALQAEQTKALIDNLKAKTSRLRSKDPIIKIDATELYPETEAFMWAMMNKVRIKASQDAADFLLGVTS